MLLFNSRGEAYSLFRLIGLFSFLFGANFSSTSLKSGFLWVTDYDDIGADSC